MARRRRKKPLGRGKFATFIAAILMVIAVVVSFGDVESTIGTTANNEFQTYIDNGDVLVHFIDVGQGACALIQNENHGILIDSGESSYASEVISYLQDLGVDTLDYVITTHPHSDHIGGMTQIFEAFDVGTLIMPELTESNTPTTQTYENFIDYVIENDMNTEIAVPGTVYDFYGDTLEIIAPLVQDSNLNNISVISIFTSNDTKVMISGDAEIEELSSIELTDFLDCDIMTMSHHGSYNGVYEPFLDAVDPEVAIISCGENNSYSHPHDEALTYLEESEIEYYRTDTDSTIVFVIDENGYQVFV